MILEENQNDFFSEIDKKILSETTLASYYKIMKIMNFQNWKIICNIIGQNKNGKSLFSNYHLKVSQLNQDQDQIEHLFSVGSMPTTSQKTLYEHHLSLSSKQVYFQQITSEDDENKDHQSLSFDSLASPAKFIKKQKIKKISYEMLYKCRQQQDQIRKQKLKLIQLSKMFQIPNDLLLRRQKLFMNQQKILNHSFYYSMSQKILDKMALSRSIILCDHPGLNQHIQTYLKHLKKKNQNQQKAKKERVIIKQLKFKESQIITYCSAFWTGFFNQDHRTNIKILLEQNDPKLISFAFCFYNYVPAEVMQRKRKLQQLFSCIFITIPKQILSIISQIISEAQKDINLFETIGKQRFQFLNQTSAMLQNYLRSSHKKFIQILSKQQQKQIIKQTFQALQIKKIFDDKKILNSLLQMYPTNLIHCYGFQQGKDAFNNVKQLQTLQNHFKINLINSYKIKTKYIVKQVFDLVQKQVQIGEKQIKGQLTKLNLPPKQKIQVQKFYNEIKTSFFNFIQLLKFAQNKYHQSLKKQIQYIKQSYHNFIDDKTQEDIINKCRFVRLIQEKIIKNFQVSINVSTQRINIAVNQFNTACIEFVNNEFKSFKDKLDKFFQKIVLIIKGGNKTQSEVTQSLIQTYKQFLVQQILLRSKENIANWNKFVQQRRVPFTFMNFRIALHKIANSNQHEYKYCRKIDYGGSSQKIYVKVANLISGVVISAANIVATKIKTEGDKQIYHKQWEALVQIFQAQIPRLTSSNLVKKTHNELITKAAKNYIYVSRKVQSVDKLQSLQEKINDIRNHVKERLQVVKTNLDLID